jgi:hypothetical protein
MGETNNPKFRIRLKHAPRKVGGSYAYFPSTISAAPGLKAGDAVMIIALSKDKDSKTVTVRKTYEYHLRDNKQVLWTDLCR